MHIEIFVKKEILSGSAGNIIAYPLLSLEEVLYGLPKKELFIPEFTSIPKFTDKISAEGWYKQLYAQYEKKRIDYNANRKKGFFGESEIERDLPKKIYFIESVSL